LSRPLVVTGASGILGDALLRSGLLADAIGVVHRHDVDHPSVTLDLRDAPAVASALAELRPRAVIHTVALTDVDACDRDPGAAFAVSVATTHNLASWIAAKSPETVFVYISSDQVYAGEGPHREERTQPLNTYGQSKRAGELAAAQAPHHLVLRTNFFGHSDRRPSYTDWIASTVRDGNDVLVDAASIFSALHLDDLTALVAASVERGLDGNFNLGAHDSIRKLDFARAVAELATPGGGSQVGTLATSADRAPRPLDLRLDVSRIEAALDRTMPTIADGLARVATELQEPQHAA
jgi:dTDP-4-dehydrorhamnose reductase